MALRGVTKGWVPLCAVASCQLLALLLASHCLVRAKGSSAEMQAPGRSPGMIPGFFPLPLLNRGCSEAKNILGWWRGRDLAGLFQAPSHSLKQLCDPPGACCLRARSQGMAFVGKGELLRVPCEL